ncbi:MAG TPA: hypothetical protein VG274_07255 [Rhizomicrobium sp.]|nr:hypothetical protein [Rhizomicrobium sp.]
MQFIDSASQYLYRDFSVVASKATATNSGCGTAISSTFATGLSPATQHGGVVENLYVGTDGVTTGDPDSAVAWSHFNIGMDLTGTHRPFVFNTLFSGCTGKGVKGN